jgi:hypothetical protein
MGVGQSDTLSGVHCRLAYILGVASYAVVIYHSLGSPLRNIF